MNPFKLFSTPRCAPPRWVGVLLVIACLLSACGNGQNQTEAANTFTLEAQGSRYLALQDGVGDWQVLSDAPGGLLTLTLSDPQGRYGVVSVCLDEASGALSVQVKHGVVPALSLGVAATVTRANRNAAETLPLVRLPCGTASAVEVQAEVRGPVRGLRKGEYSSVYLGSASALVDTSAPVPSLELRSGSADKLDLVATKYGPGARLPSVLLVEPGLEPAANGVTSVDIDFSSPEAVALEPAEVPLGGVRPGELLSGSVELLSASGTRALLGEFTDEGVLTYARPPASLLRGAALRASAQSFAYNDQTKAGSSRSAARTFTGGLVTSLVLPPPVELEPPVLVGGAALLRPRSSWAAQANTEGDYTQFYSQIRDGHNVSYRATQSLAYLRLRFPNAATFSQTLPDFGGLRKWQSDWNLQRGADLFWDVSFSAETEEESVFSSRSGVLGTALSTVLNP